VYGVIKKEFNRIGLVILLLIIQPCQADIYFWTDEQGKKHFSDTKHPSAIEYQQSQHISFYSIKTVYDGDTVQLEDGRKIRLAGINTPEIAHRNNRAQEGGDAAKQWLTQVLSESKVRLEFAEQKQDRYKRYLAHIFTEEGIHINLELVRLGFASINVFPPNIAYVDALLKASNSAEIKQIGIWRYPSYKTKLTSELNQNNKQGWQRIVGKVIKIKRTKKNVYLIMSDTFKLQIKKQFLEYFPKISDLKGKKVEVRGWVNKNKKQYLMQVMHPSVLKFIH